MLLEHFYWGSVFLINVPIVLVVVALTARYVPRQAGRRDQSLNLGHAIMLIVAILLLVYSYRRYRAGAGERRTVAGAVCPHSAGGESSHD